MSRSSAGGKPTPQQPGARLDAPAYHRNIEPILEALASRLPERPANVLEIGCGTGQHVVRFAQVYPQHTFWPTDLDDSYLTSTRAWITDTGCDNVCPPVMLDAAEFDWPLGTPHHPPADIDVIFSANVIHISPPSVMAGLFAGAGRHLRPGGILFLYGPFRRDGQHTAPSNETFETWLTNQNPLYGVRDLDGEVTDHATVNGLTLGEALPMPSNNFLNCFVKQA